MAFSERMADVTDGLRERGFEFKERAPDDGWFVYHGPLEADGRSYQCEFRVDPLFSQYPHVRLLQRPEGLSLVAPHMGSDSNVCYIAKGTVVLDIFDPVGQTLACVERAGEVLNKIIKGEFVDDLEDEFFAYWLGKLCLVDLQNDRLGRHTTLMVQNGASWYPVVTDDPARTRSKLNTLGWTAQDAPLTTFRLKTTAKPRPHNTRWPIESVQQLLEWQGLLDQNCRRKLLKRLEEAKALKLVVVIFIIESPLMNYGLCVDFRRDAQRQSVNKRVLPTPLFALPAMPLEVVRLDDRYATERNQPGRRTLAGKRLVLAGCGTIGGFLAEMLVKAGAGTDGGKLLLVDFDTLRPQNLGRHRLGFSSLFASKAVGLRREFERAAPGAEVVALHQDAQDAELGDFDLLIDATGEESLGHWLAHKYRTAQMLSVWIEGPGVAVRGLLRAKAYGACFRCLCDANKAGQLRTVEGEMPQVRAGQGCEGLYVPFSATVSVQAAALGAEMVSAWVNGDDAAALRTRVLDSKFQQATADCNPARLSKCPACS